MLLCLPCWLVPALPGQVSQEQRKREEALHALKTLPPACLKFMCCVSPQSRASVETQSSGTFLCSLSFFCCGFHPTTLTAYPAPSPTPRAGAWGHRCGGHPLVHHSYPARPTGARWAPGEASGADGDPLLGSWLAGAALCCLHPSPAGWFNSSSPGFGDFFIEIESLRTKSVYRMDNLFWEEVIDLLTRSSQLYLKPDSAGVRVTHGCSKPQREALFLGKHLFPPLFPSGKGRKANIRRCVGRAVGRAPPAGGTGRSCSINGCRQPRRQGARAVTSQILVLKPLLRAVSDLPAPPAPSSASQEQGLC